MRVDGMSTALDIAVSGHRAETRRMNVFEAHIANPQTTETASGEPYRRKHVVLGAGQGDLTGVQVQRVAEDMTTAFKRVYIPGHPKADDEGFVQMPNVDLPVEMVNMISAGRAYQANAAVMKQYRELVDVAIELLR